MSFIINYITENETSWVVPTPLSGPPAYVAEKDLSAELIFTSEPWEMSDGK